MDRPPRAGSVRRFARLFNRSGPGTGTFRLGVAFLMALVSLASAYVTHVATDQSSQATGLHGTASQQAAEEQQVEQQIDAIVAQELRLTARLDEHWHAYTTSTAEARKIRAADPVAAGELDLTAQAGWELVRQLWPFYRGAVPKLTADSVTYDEVAARSALRIRDWRLYRASSAVTTDQASRAAKTASAMVLVVVLLVASLFLLTVAHLAGGGRGLAVAAIALATAVGAVAWLASFAFDAALPLLWSTLGLLMIGLIVRQLGRGSEWLSGAESVAAVPDIIEVPTSPGSTAVADPEASETSPLILVVALAIAIVTLFGTAVGYLHGTTSSASDDAGWEARDLGVQAIGALRAAEERTAVAVDTYELALQQRIAGWNALQRADHARSIGDEARAATLREEAGRFEALAARSEARSGIGENLGSSGISDDGALRALRAEAWRPAAEIAARQDAANATSRNLGEQAALYLSVLAWLAVAVYLLGLSLVFRQVGVRRLLATAGCALVLAAMVRTAWVLTMPGAVPDETARRSATAYAAGFVALERNDADAAEAHLTEALRSRDDFGLAHRERSQAILQSGSVQGSGIRSVFTPEAVELAITDLHAARAAGAETAGVLLNLAAMNFHRSIHEADPAIMESSLDWSRRGLELGKEFARTYGVAHLNEAIGLTNLALGLAGTGQLAEAEAAYRDVAAATRALPVEWRPYLVGAALTTIDILGSTNPPTPRPVITRMKEVTVAGVFGAATAAPATVESLRAEAFPSILQWRATIPGLDPGRDVLVTQWYRLDAPADRWYVLPIASGPVTLDVPTAGGQFHRDVGEDAYWGNTNGILRDVPPTCTLPGTYRLELYLNGVLARATEVAAPAQTFYPHLARDVGFGMCMPEGFVPVAVDPGFSNGIAQADGSRGVVVFRVLQPLTADGAVDLRSALERLLGSQPAGLPESLSAGQPLEPGTQGSVFGRLEAIWQRHRYPGGVAEISSVASAQGTGTVLITCIYGPDAWIDSPESIGLMLSLTEH